MNNTSFFSYLLVMAGVTYMVRMLPLVLVKKKIHSTFLLSFLHYMPFAVLSVMTIPSIFYATDYRVSSLVGFITAMILSYFEKSLVKVAAFTCLTAFLTELLLRYVF